MGVVVPSSTGLELSAFTRLELSGFAASAVLELFAFTVLELFRLATLLRGLGLGSILLVLENFVEFSQLFFVVNRHLFRFGVWLGA